MTPRVSVITVVLNDCFGLAATLSSVGALNYSSLQTIVQDGGTDEETPKFVDQFKDYVDVYSREPDTGIYDAMNKAVDKARGEFVLFMNARDVFAAPGVLAKLVENMTGSVGIVYGKAVSKERGTVHVYKPQNLYWTGSILDHQACLIRRNLLVEYPFDTTLRIAGDLDFFSKCKARGVQFKSIAEIIAIKPFSEGASSSYLRRFSERFLVLTRHFGHAFPVEQRLRAELLDLLPKVLSVNEITKLASKYSLQDILTELEPIRPLVDRELAKLFA